MVTGKLAMGRRNAALAIALLALGLTGVALAGVTTRTAETAGSLLNISVRDGGLTVSTKTLSSGKVTLVVVNKGTKKHGLAIMGTGFAPKRTPTIAAGKTARLVVTLKAGRYHVWDPVTSSMSRATYLTVKAPVAAKSSGGGGTGGTSSGSGAGSSYPPSGGTGSTGGGGGAGGMDPGMEGCDHG
jgi:uncharacterized membrane protein YgcG